MAILIAATYSAVLPFTVLGRVMDNPDILKFEPAHLLVVDDDPILREFALANLTGPSVTVEVVEDGEQGWQRLKRGGVHIALVDLEMPVLDGFGLIARMRADEELAAIPVVVATSRDDLEAIDRAYAAGATSFVLKPLNWRVVAYQLSYVLRNSREEARIRANARALRLRLRAQDQVVSACEQGVNRLLNTLLEELPHLAAAGVNNTEGTGTGSLMRLVGDIEKLRAEMRGTSEPLW